MFFLIVLRVWAGEARCRPGEGKEAGFSSSRPANAFEVRRRMASKAAEGRDRSRAEQPGGEAEDCEHGEDPPFDGSRCRASDLSP